MAGDIFFKGNPVNIPQLIFEIRKFNETDEALNKLCALFEYQEQRISLLYDMVYKIAPDLEIIECMADSIEEQQELIEKYMNHGNYSG